MSRDNLLVGLDIGTSKVATVIGEVDDQGMITIVGWSSVVCTGLKKGIVVDIEQTVRAIENSVQTAEKMADVHINSVFVSVSGDHIASINNTGVIAIGSEAGEITRNHIEKVMESAQTVSIPPNKEIIQILARDFKVDDQKGIKDPLTMSGTRLEADVHIITGSASSIQNVITAVEKAGLQVADLVVSAVASSEACLSEEDKNLGIAIIDIGAGATDIAVFKKGALVDSKVLPVGGGHVTNDLAVGLTISTSEAERIKIEHAHATMDDAPRNGQVILNMGKDEKATLAYADIVDIVGPRMEEIFDLIQHQLVKNDLIDHIPRGIVITGGASQLKGTKKLAEKVFKKSDGGPFPVRIGTPGNLKGLIDKINTPVFSGAVGLLHYGVKNIFTDDYDEVSETSFFSVKGFFEKIYNLIFGND
jgi:cell division protein FtsA